MRRLTVMASSSAPAPAPAWLGAWPARYAPPLSAEYG